MSQKVKKKHICCGLEISMHESLERISLETGAKKSEIVRRAIKKYEDGAMDDCLMVLNVVQLVQLVNDMKKEMKPEYMVQLQQLAENMVKIKGGK